LELFLKSYRKMCFTKMEAAAKREEDLGGGQEL
jgi:hypothetical protein